MKETTTIDGQDAFKFCIQDCDDDFISFQVSMTNCHRKLLLWIILYYYIQMYFNCWTLCQKGNFCDKKQNLCLRAKLTGAGVEDVLITKAINVQQNPGRGAKVVQIKNRTTNYKQFRPVNPDGTVTHSIIKVSIRFALGYGQE